MRSQPLSAWAKLTCGFALSFSLTFLTSCTSNPNGSEGGSGGAVVGPSGAISQRLKARAVGLKGSVWIQPEGADEWQRLGEGEVVEEGAVIQTRASSSVDLRFAENTSAIHLAPGTQVTLNELKSGPGAAGEIQANLSVWYGEVSGTVSSGGEGSRITLDGDDGRSLRVSPWANQQLGFKFEVAQPMFRFSLLPESTPGIPETWPGDYYLFGSPIIPEPTSLALLGLSSAVLLLRRKRLPELPR